MTATTIPTTATNTTNNTGTATRRSTAATRRLTRAACVVTAAVATGTLFAVGRATGADFTIADPGANTEPHTFVFTEIVVVTAIIALAGWATLAVLERFTSHARVVWSVLATVVVLLSLPPIWIEQATTDTRFFLAAVHLAVGAALVPMVRRS